MKTRLVWILTGLAALVAVAVLLILPNPHDLAVGKVKYETLPKGQAILVKTRAERFGVQKGDVFLYLVEVLYDPGQVSHIDRASLDKNVNLEPFEIRGVKETESDLDPTTRLYQRQYEVQLINGDVAHLYEFPTLVVRYSLKDVEGFADEAVVPEPIYVASRLPANVSNLVENLELGYGPLRPLRGEIEDVSQNRLPWILWVLGGCLAAVTLADLSFRVIAHRKEKTEPTIEVDKGDVLYQAYRALHGNLAAGAEPKAVLHQMDHMLRIVLARKVRTDWLEEPDFDEVAPGIRTLVVSLFDKCQIAYRPEFVEQIEVEEALRQLEEIFEFYFAEEVEAWKRQPSS